MVYFMTSFLKAVTCNGYCHTYFM